jgi:DNA-binding NtrC family response regulator
METSLNDSEVPSRQLHRPVSFLVVDDEQRARKSLIELLNSNWTDITEAEDGEQAIALIQKRQFNLIILDLNMPTKSGDQVLAFIRDNKITTPVIVISGEASINKVTEAMRLGAYDIPQTL